MFELRADFVPVNSQATILLGPQSTEGVHYNVHNETGKSPDLHVQVIDPPPAADLTDPGIDTSRQDAAMMT